jgi:hypothetical protein
MRGLYIDEEVRQNSGSGYDNLPVEEMKCFRVPSIKLSGLCTARGQPTAYCNRAEQGQPSGDPAAGKLAAAK